MVDWFVDNKLSVHFGEDKTKSILSSPKHRLKSIGLIDISYKDAKIKKYSKVTYLGCVLDECLTGKSMTMPVCTKVTSKLKFLYRKNRFISKDLRRLLCKALIQPHFDHACAAWYPNLNKKHKYKLQVLQSKCTRFCLQLDNREHFGTEHFDKINWLPIDQRFKQCLSTTVFKFFSEMCAQYMNEIYKTTNQNNTVTRNSFLKLFQPLRTEALSQNALPDDVKLSNNVNTFKHKVKKDFLILLREKDQDIYVYYE